MSSNDDYVALNASATTETHHDSTTTVFSLDNGCCPHSPLLTQYTYHQR